MSTIQIGSSENSFLIYFGTESHRLNAYTLASTLVGIADAAKAANATINPGYEIEVVVEALSDGSFRASLQALYRKTNNIFSSEPVKTITYSIIGAFIYQHTLGPDQEITISTSDAEVVIEQGDTRIIVPREVHEAIKEVEKSPNFRKGISDTMRAIESDKEIESVGFSETPFERYPPPQIPRSKFALLTTQYEEDEPDLREMTEVTDLQILRAVLERSHKLWQFGWNGIRISAPVTSSIFYDDFFSHKIVIAPGDVLRVKLRIKQKLNKDLGVYLNESYEVVEVLDLIAKAQQARFDD